MHVVAKVAELAVFHKICLKWPETAIIGQKHRVYTGIPDPIKCVVLPRNLVVSQGIHGGYSSIHNLAW